MALLREYKYIGSLFSNGTRKWTCIHKMTNFTLEAYKHANRTIDDVKVPAKCDIRERLLTRNLRAKQKQK